MIEKMWMQQINQIQRNHKISVNQRQTRDRDYDRLCAMFKNGNEGAIQLVDSQFLLKLLCDDLTMEDVPCLSY